MGIPKNDNSNIKTYAFNSANNVAKRAADEITIFLEQLPITTKVENVENDPLYQGKDIDLIWHYLSRKTGELESKTIEIKGDRYEKSGNYFFETISNVQKNTPGCFMYTEADWIFYYFVNPKILHILPTFDTRNWFIRNQLQFYEATTSTSGSKGLLYTSKGRKVPISTVSKHIKVDKFNLNQFLTSAVS